MNKIIKLAVMTGQCTTVYHPDGLLPTFTVGVHGYAFGYILVEDNDKD